MSLVVVGLSVTLPLEIANLPLNIAEAKEKKSRFNSQIYESEPTEQRFSAKVKLLRDMDETEVFFESSSNGGPYILSSKNPNIGMYKARLEKSRKKGLPVNVVVDNDHIKSVEIVEAKERVPASEKELIDSIFKK